MPTVSDSETCSSTPLPCLFFDLLVPDFIPLIDELILGLLAILFVSWKKQRPLDEPGGNVIEGEVISQDED